MLCLVSVRSYYGDVVVIMLGTNRINLETSVEPMIKRCCVISTYQYVVNVFLISNS